jgi:glycosyltransferase 2 family protein
MYGPPVKYAVRVLISTLLLVFIFQNMDPDNTALALNKLALSHLFSALALQLASNSVAALRWHLIMQRLGLLAPFTVYLKSYFKGCFFNQGLPTSIGGDGLRILDCTRIGASTEEAFFGVFIDRIVGLAGLLLLNLVALLSSPDLIPKTVYWPLLLLLMGLSFGLWLLFFLRKFSWFQAGKQLAFLGRLSERYVQVYSSFASISLQLALSVFTHLLSIWAFFMLGQGLGLDFPLYVYLVLVPPVILLTILPLSLAGWGIREGALIGLFLLIGAEQSKVLTLSILYGLTALVASLPGLLVYLTQKHKL